MAVTDQLSRFLNTSSRHGASYALHVSYRGRWGKGACNRAYYAMYDAAHAALLAENRADYKVTKTHSGLISAFALHIVSTNKISRELGRAFN
jgi:uncharacterized protein (UPF0332 family)